MVQAFFCRVLSRGGNRRAIFHLGAAASEIDSGWAADSSSTRDRDHWKLLLFQSAHDRAVLITDRRLGGWGEPRDHSCSKVRRALRSRPSTTIVRLYWAVCDHRDVTDQRLVNLQRIQTAESTTKRAGESLRKARSVSHCERLRAFSRDDERPLRNRARRQR